MRRSVGLLALVVGCGGSRPALPPLDASPAAPSVSRTRSDASGPRDAPFEPPRITTRVLDNGVTITRLHRPTQRMPTMAVAFTTMSSSDPVDDIVVEALRRRVHGDSPMECWASSFADAAGPGLVLDMTADAAPASAATLFSALTEPLPKKTIEKARLRVMRSRADASRYGEGMVETILRRERYGADHPWGRDAIAVVQALDALETAELAKRVRERLRPAGIHVVFSGPTDAWDRIDLSKLERWTAAAGEALPPVTVPPGRTDGKTKFHMLGSSPDRSSLFALHVGPGVLSPDHAAFATLCSLLGGMLSEAGREFRHEGGETYGVHTRMVERREASECLWSGTFVPGKLARAADQHLEQLKRLGQGDVDPRGVAAARGQVMARADRRFAAARDLVRWTARQRAFGFTPEEIRASWAAAPDLSERRLVEVAREAFDPEHVDFVAFVGATQDYYGLSARGAVLRYQVERTDD